MSFQAKRSRRLEAAAASGWAAQANSQQSDSNSQMLGEEFRSYLMEAFMKGDMSAKVACAVAYYYTEAGGRSLGDLAVHPRHAGGYASSRMKVALGRDLSLIHI